jgi:hypothetical protein
MLSRWPERAIAALLPVFLFTTDPFAQTPACPVPLWTPGPGLARSPVALHLAEDVGDPLFALLAGLLDAGAYGTIGPACLDSVMTAEGGTSLPYDLIRLLAREPGDSHRDAVVRIEFRDEFKVAVPYSILGYHPGDMSSQRELVLYEWRLRDQMLRIPAKDDPAHELTLHDVHLFAVQTGRVDLDVDWWLDKLLRGKLDDVHVTGFLVFRREDTRYGLAFGYTKGGKGRTGLFDLTRDEIVFPAPYEYLYLGRSMRAHMETLLESARRADRRPGGTVPRG